MAHDEFPVSLNKIPELIRLRAQEIIQLVCVFPADVAVGMRQAGDRLDLLVFCANYDFQDLTVRRKELLESIQYIVEALALRHGFRATIEIRRINVSQ